MMIEYLSYSSINLYLTCPEAWRRKYIEKQPTITTPALVFGTAFHNTIEEYIETKATSGVNFSLADLWPHKWQAAVEREPDCDWGAETPEEHHNEGLRLLGNPELLQLANRLRPLRGHDSDADPWLERRCELRVPGVPVPIIGYIDIVTSDGIPGDFKTSKASWSQDKARNELQPVFYLAALNQMGHSVPGLRFRHYVVTKAKTSKVQELEHQHTWDEIFWLYELIQSVWQAIEREAFPLNPTGWMCSPKYCSFWSTCRGRTL